MIRVMQAALSIGLGGVLLSSAALAQTQLKASHQWPSGKGDVRDEMVQIIAREVAAAGVDLEVRIYPAASLFKPTQQWDAMVDGQLDISAFPLDYASGKHPQFSATLMPGLVKNHDHAKRLNDSAFMDDIKKIIDESGIMVLSDAWLAGGFASKQGCILQPEDAQGQVMRAAGPAERITLPEASAGSSTQPPLLAKPPASQASDSTMMPASSMICLMSSMNGESLRRLACSWFLTRPGISVALNCGCLPLA